MSLTELISGVEDHEKRLTVFNTDEETVEAVREQFRDRNLTVVGDRSESGRPGSFVVLSSERAEGEDEFVTATSVDDVLSAPRGEGAELDSEVRHPILDHLDETMFTSYDTRQMVAASREIEDRAWRLGEGSLHAGFQQLSILSDQMEVYTRLASREDLDVHAYACPDTEVPEHDTDLTIHVERSDEIAKSWFVVYDGNGVDVNKCALLAEERESRAFYGFWTYDPDTVDWLIEYLEGAYGLIEQ
ncbi:DICT sensory domain-containing protein [Haloglomus halophilum]|uniref:DICT sensory domain-containing protein n=1 Tax=Haloglomus halophilum TaxID=2962672 RepID=UPI0020C98CAD|nr:DICT sensory domain-containing protein [Haloglomus halophilum]